MIIVKPWGRERIIEEGENFWIKRLEVKSNCRLSLQYHLNRKEIMTVIEGSGSIYLQNKVIPLVVGDVITVNQKEIHRLFAGKEGITVIEVAAGKPEAEDIVRLEDDYHRT